LPPSVRVRPRAALSATSFRGLGDTEATLSIITVVELAHGLERADSTTRRVARERFLNELLNELSVEPITIPIALRAGKIDGNSQAQELRVALGDLLIGTTALELGYAVATRNIRHFQMIPDLVVKQI
jgi:predicted nucleic acid-binding protein